MTRIPELNVPSAVSSSVLLFLMRAAVARTREWSRRLRAGLLAPDLEEDSTRYASREHGAGFFSFYSDAKLQILLAELHYPRWRTGCRRD